jgi:quinohemoprotein ethanol dehydrogenase
MIRFAEVCRNVAIIGLSVMIAACGGGGESSNAQSPQGPKTDPTITADDWPNFGGDGRELHYAAADEISQANIDRLGLAWHYELESGFTVSAPVEAGGKLFTTSGHSRIRAFDAVTGKLLWEFDGKTREIAQTQLHMTWGNKGLSYWNGKVIIATTDGRVIAIDANTGKQVWEQRDFELTDLRNGNGPPRVFGGKVIIGHGGADISPIRGYVTAYDADTGKRLWRFHTVPSDPSKPAENKADEVMRATWKGDWFGKGGGGTAWNAFSYDADLNLIYLGVGNGYPYNQAMRSPGGGDNLFLASIVAVNADTGEYVWHYQVCPGEEWDCTAVMDMSLADVTIDGKPRKVLIQAPKNGFVYVIDRTNGQFISAEKFAKVTWAERIDPTTGRPVENPGVRYDKTGKMFELWPGPQGAHSWLPQAFSPRTGLLYIPVMEMGAMIGPPQPGMGGIGAGNGATLIPDAELPGSRRSFLRAWDPIAQKEAWSIQLPGVWPGGVLATGGDLVFQGRIDGQLVAYDAKTGKQVWSFKAQAPIVAPPISYRVNGKQYITVLTGSGSQGGGLLGIGNAAYRTDYRLPRHVLTFTIDGKDKLPDFTPPKLVAAIDPTLTKPDPDMVMKGAMAYANGACLVCHGMNAVGAGAAPDLRYSPMILDKNAFHAVVKDGALKANGMPPQPQVSEPDVELIRYYLRVMALQTMAGPAPTKQGSKPVAGM